MKHFFALKDLNFSIRNDFVFSMILYFMLHPRLFFWLTAKAKRLPASVELLALELPGRGGRMSEALRCDTLQHLAEQALDGIGAAKN